MKKFLTITAILLVAVMIAGPAFAAVQNVRVSGSVDSKYLYRKDFDLGNSGSSQEQSLFITWTILQVDADLTDQVSATVALLNERTWDQSYGDDQGDFDILLAYVTLREMLYSPLTLIVGRQSFAFGNSFIIDSAGTNNAAFSEAGLADIASDLTKSTTLDSIRAILDYNPLTIDIVFSQIDEGDSTANSLDDDIVLYGINANYQLGDDYDSIVEAYFWKFIDKSIKDACTGCKADEVYTVGGRVSTNPFDGWNTQLEVAYQKGNHNHDVTGDPTINRKRDAWAIQAIANWQIPGYDEYRPTLQYVFTKVTGESDAGADAPGGDWNGWHPMLENQGGGKIYSAIFDLTNSIIHEVTFGFNPMEDVLAKLSLTSIHLQSKLNPNITTLDLVQPGETTAAVKEIKRDNSHLGKEIDFELEYMYTEDVRIHTALGWFFPGSVFRGGLLNENNTAKQVLVNLDVAF